MDKSQKNTFNTVNSFVMYVLSFMCYYTQYVGFLMDAWHLATENNKGLSFFSPPNLCVLRGMETLVAECQPLSQLLIMFHITM